MARAGQGQRRTRDEGDERTGEGEDSTSWSVLRRFSDATKDIANEPIAAGDLHPLGELVQCAFEFDHRCPISTRNRARARAVRDFTVPAATSSARAVSVSDSPAK